MSAHIFALINQKGGIGKTTASLHLGVGLKRKGYKVLMVDMDPQCNLTFALKGEYRKVPTIMEAIFKEVDISSTIQHLAEVDLIPGSNNLSSLEPSIKEERKEFFLKDIIEPLRQVYDYIVVDSPPALSLITVGVMVAVDSLIIPVGMDIFSIQGTGQLYRSYQAVKQYSNKKLEIDGIFVAKNSRSLKALLEEVAGVMKVKIFETKISANPIVQHAAIAQKSLYTYAPEASVTKQYGEFVDEVLNLRSKERSS